MDFSTSRGRVMFFLNGALSQCACLKDSYVFDMLVFAKRALGMMEHDPPEMKNRSNVACGPVVRELKERMSPPNHNHHHTHVAPLFL